MASAKTATHEAAPRKPSAAKKAETGDGFHYVIVERLKGELESLDQMERYLDMGYEVAPGEDENRRRIKMRIPEKKFAEIQKDIEEKANSRVVRRDAKSQTGISDQIKFGNPLSVQDLKDIEEKPLGPGEFDPRAGLDTKADESLNG